MAEYQGAEKPRRPGAHEAPPIPDQRGLRTPRS
jgi:hypothetical protein